MFDRIFRKSREDSIEKSALIISLATIIGSILGILKNTVLASNFGASRDLDIYFAAFRVPDFLYSLLVFSSLSGSFMPIFAKAIKNGKNDAWSLVSGIFSVFSAFFGIFAVLALFFSDDLAMLIAPGFSSMDSEKLSLMLKILMIQPIFLSVSNLFSVTLQGFKKFFVSSLAPVFYNFGIIVGVLWLSDFWGINGVAWGVVLGAFLHLLIQLPGLFSLGFRFRFDKTAFDFLREVGLLMAPRSLTILMNNVVLFWITSISSLLAAGSLAIFNLADSLQSLPLTIAVMSLVTASFPFLSQKWADFKEDQSPEKKNYFVATFDRVLSEIVLLIVPIAFLLAVFSRETVGILFGYGNFLVQDQLLTSLTLTVFAVFLPFQALTMFLIRAFFATANTKDPLLARMVSALVFQLPLIWFMSQLIGVPGIALGTGLGFVIDSLILFFVFKKRIGISGLPLSKNGFFTGLRWGSLIALPVLILNLSDYYFLNLGFLGFLALKIFFLAACLGFGIKLKYLKFSDFKTVFHGNESR